MLVYGCTVSDVGEYRTPIHREGVLVYVYFIVTHVTVYKRM